MSKELERTARFERAQKRVKQLKGFYNHLKIFVLFHLVFFLLKSGVLHSFLPNGFPTESYYFDWIYWNLAIWGLIVAIHAVFVFIPSPFKKWEEKQIKEYMKKDKEETEKFTGR